MTLCVSSCERMRANGPLCSRPDATSDQIFRNPKTSTCETPPAPPATANVCVCGGGGTPPPHHRYNVCVCVCVCMCACACVCVCKGGALRGQASRREEDRDRTDATSASMYTPSAVPLRAVCDAGTWAAAVRTTALAVKTGQP